MNRAILTKQEKTMYKAKRLHILQYPGVCQLFILACIGADAFTLFSVFDLLLTQQTNITLVITITVAAVMNIAPMLLAACLRNDELNKRMKIVLCSLLAGVFAMLFVVTFSLRFTSQEQLYSSASDISIIQDGDTEQSDIDGENDTIKLTTAQNILAVILGLEPLATSICSFVLAYEISPSRKRRHLMEMHRYGLEEEIDRDRVMIQELKADMEYNLDEYDKNQYEQMRAIIYQQGELAKIKAIRKLAEHDGTAEGISYLMEEEYMKAKKETESVETSSARLSEEKAFEKIKSIA